MTSLFYIRSAMYDVFNLYGTVYIKHDNKLHINNLISRLENIKNKLIKHLFLLKIKRPKRIPPSAAARFLFCGVDGAGFWGYMFGQFLGKFVKEVTWIW